MTRPIECYLLVALLVLAGAGVAPAQQTTTDAPAADATGQAPLWPSRCVADSRGSAVDCTIEQRAFVQNTGQLVAAVTVRVPADTGKPVLMVQTALGLFLPAGVTLGVDGSDPVKFDLQTCDANGCYAGAPLSDELLSAMERGEKLNVAFQNLKKQTISVPLPLMGFAASYQKIQ